MVGSTATRMSGITVPMLVLLGGDAAVKFGSPAQYALSFKGEDSICLTVESGGAITPDCMLEISDKGVSIRSDHVSVKGSLTVDAMAIGGVPQWALYHRETEGLGWDNPGPDIMTSCAGVTMIGGPGKFAAGEITKSFQLPTHSAVRLEGTYHFIDGWRGDSGFIRASVGGQGDELVHLWSDSHYETNRTTLDLCGGPTSDSKFVVPFRFSFPHSDPTLRIGVGSSIETGTDPDSMSWGFSGLEIHLLS